MANKISDEELNINVKVHADESRKQMDDLAKANKSMADQNKKLLKEKKALAAAGLKESGAYKTLSTQINENNDSIKENREEHKKLMKGIDLTQKSMRELKNESGKLSGQLANEVPGTDEYKRLQKELGAAKQRMYEMRQENLEVQKSMGSAESATDQLADSMSNVVVSLKNGNLPAAAEGIQAIRGNIVGMTKASLAFIATPLGAALAIVAGIGASVAYWASFNKELLGYKKIVEDITGVEGKLNTQMVNRARALEKVYGTDFKESITTADTLVKTFGGTHQEAMDIIASGLDAGMSQNDEYFDSLKEYSTFYAQAGYSAQEFKNMINKGYDLKLYSDKLPDAIKEAAISLNEATPATREALENAFGPAFSDDLLSRINDGTVNIKQALQEIKKESDSTQPSIQQQAQLTADVFRGAGEDAGGWSVMMDAVGASSEDAVRKLNPLQEKMAELRLETEKTMQSQTDALESTSFQVILNKLEIYWEKTKQLFFNYIGAWNDLYAVIYQSGSVFINRITGVFSALPTIIRAIFKEAIKEIKELGGAFTSLGGIIDAVQNGDFSTAKKRFQDYTATLKKEFTDITDLRKKLSAAISNELKKADKETLDRLLIERQAVEEGKKAEIKSLNSIKSLEEEISKLRNQYANATNQGQRDKLKKEIEALEKKRDQFTGAKKGTAAGDSGLTDEDQFTLDSRKSLQALLDAFDEEQKIKKATKNLEKLEADKLREELELENKYAKLEEQYATETDLLKKLEEQKQIELQDIKDRYQDLEAQATLERMQMAIKEAAAKKKIKENEVNQAIALEQQKVQVAKNAFGALVTLLGQQTAAGKAAAIAQATINTYQGVTEVWKTPSTLPEPFATISRVASTATVLASGLKSVGAIKSQDPTLSGFEDGYYPWSQTVTRDDGKKYGAAYGGATKTGVVSRPTVFTDYLTGEGNRKELIVDSRTFSRLDPSVISHIQRAAHGITGYESGFVGDAAKQFTQTGNTASNEQLMRSEERDSMILQQLMLLNQRLSVPLKATAQIGFQEAQDIEDLNTTANNSRNKARP